MPEDTAAPDDLLSRAREASAGSLERRLLTAAAFAGVALDDAVLVGGAAVDLHTGSYRPTDIDLVGRFRPGAKTALSDRGFEREGRHWLFQFPDGEILAIEVPDDRLDGYAVEAPAVVDLGPGRLAVIALSDLMMDRLLQATGGEQVTMDEAVRLATAAYERIDWQSLTQRCEAAARDGTLAGAELPVVLSAVRRAARRHLRP